ncbi:hypothetical protein AAC387_Pa10g1555 [Persea americana]
MHIIDQACGRTVVSCADILAIAARDSVVRLGGPTYSVPVGRRDARTASRDGANSNLPRFTQNLDKLIQVFSDQGFTEREMVALSGAHTVGQAQCATFRDRIYNETNIDAAFATCRQANCPRAAPNGNGNLAPLDPQSPNRFAHLSVSFYANTCPSVFETVRTAVRSAINREARMGGSLIRLFFHDCFVNGCDGGILLEDTASFVGERTAVVNNNSARGFEVVDEIKTRVDQACGRTVVSCADILAIAARDSVVQLGGPTYSVPVGRRDARTASRDGANSNLPRFTQNLDKLIQVFSDQGFTEREMVALSGAHTVGQAKCATFRDRIYNETNIDAAFATCRQANCPRVAPNGNGNLAPLDPQSPNRFDRSSSESRMGVYRHLLGDPGSIDHFRDLYKVPSNVEVRPDYPEDGLTYRDGWMPFWLVSVVEAGVRFPLHPLVRDCL